MSTIKTMSLDEVAKYEIPAKDLKRLNGFKNSDFSDCQKDTPEELSQYKPWYEVHPSGYGASVEEGDFVLADGNS